MGTDGAPEDTEGHNQLGSIGARYRCVFGFPFLFAWQHTLGAARARSAATADAHGQW